MTIHTTILCIEDDHRVLSGYELLRYINRHVRIVCADNLEIARYYIESIKEFDIVVFDACVPDHPGHDTYGPSTFGLISELRKQLPNAILIAASSDAGYRREQMQAGCDTAADKDEAKALVRSLIDC